MKKLGVLIIHGIGQPTRDYADACIAELNGRLLDSGVVAGRVVFEPVYWADILSDKEDRMYRDLCRAYSLRDFFGLRKFEINALADAVAYRYVPDDPKSVYRLVHQRIRNSFYALKEKLEDENPPIVVLAHSLGGHIISSYVWDAQKSHPYMGVTRDWTDFERGETLCGVVTFGCNIPLFTLALDKVEAIRFPGRNIPDELKRKTCWFNYYSPRDILGFPLAPLGGGYDRVKDVSVNVGSVFAFWNPLCHTQYWTANSFTKPVSAFLADIVNTIS